MPTTDRDGLVWRSVHVHRYDQQDEFLVDGVAPAVESLHRVGTIANFFFLRYWQGGHHIRLRVRVEPDEADTVVDELTAKLGGYLAEHPAGRGFDADQFREAQPTMATLEGERVEPVQPPDTIRNARYLPEYDKYGGQRGVAVAEEFFGRSSVIVLAQLTDAARAPGRRLGVGLSAMLRGMGAAGLSATSMARFFAHYCVLWSPYVFDEFLHAWPQLLDRQRIALRAHTSAVLGGPADPFCTAMEAACAAVEAAAADVLPKVTLAGPDAPTERRQQALMVSYLHTHNNRLGLIPVQESFLGFLGHHVLCELAGVSPDSELMTQIAAARDRIATGATGATGEHDRSPGDGGVA